MPLAAAFPLAFFLAASAGIAEAQDARGEDPQAKLQAQRSDLESAEQRAKALQADVLQINQERERLNARLLETAALIQKSEAKMTAMEARLGELDAQEKLLRGSLNQRHNQIAKLLSALQRMGRNPPPVLITKREDALQMVRSAMLLAAAFPELRTQSLALAERLNELVRVMAEAKTENEHLKAETARLNDARIRLSGLMEVKKQSLAERQADLEKVRIATADISRNVSDLNELISKLDQAVTNNTQLGPYDEALRRKADAAAGHATAQPPPQVQPATAPATEPTPAISAATPGQPAIAAIVPAPGAASKDAKEPVAPKEAEQPKEAQVALNVPPPAPRPPAIAKAPVIEIAPQGANFATGKAGRITPAIPFEQARGQLPAPAQGRRVLGYGEKTQFGGQSKGIVIETRAGGQITAPCDGWIVYAGEFRSYGQLLIINAGGGYHMLLAGLSQIDVQPGQFVLAAEPVGTMIGANKAVAGNGPSNAPVLYVELRRDGKPIDPDPWWVIGRQAEGQQKVQ